MRRYFVVLMLSLCISGCGENSETGVQIESIPTQLVEYPTLGPFALGHEILPVHPYVIGGAPTSWSISPPLPLGIVLDAESGVISGTPQQLYLAVTHMISASNGMGTVVVSVSISVLQTAPCDLSYGEQSVLLTKGIQMDPLTPANGCGSIENWTVSPDLPLGISIDGVTGVISGTPLELTSPVVFVINGFNQQGSDSVSLEIEVVDQAPCDLQYPESLVAFAFGEEIGSFLPTHGCGQALEYEIVPQLPAGILFSPESGEISGIPQDPQPSTEYLITARNLTGDTSFLLQLEVTIEAPCDLEYPQSEIVITQGDSIPGGLLPTSSCDPVDEYTVEPEFPEGVDLNASTGFISGTPQQLQPMTSYVIRAANAGGFTEFTLLLEVVPQVPCNLQYPLSEVFVNQGETFQEGFLPTSSCGHVDTYSVTPSLPEGVTLNANTGLISGVATTAQPMTAHVIRAANASGFAEVTIMLQVIPEAPCSLIYLPSNFTLEVGSFMVPAVPQYDCGIPTSFQIFPDLPPGLEIHPQTGVISGQPLGTQIVTLYTIVGSNMTGSSITQAAIVVLPQPPCDFSYPETHLELTVGQPMSTLIPELGCGEVDNFSTNLPLPAGLFLDSVTGAISGIPQIPTEASEHLISAENESGADSFQLSITIVEEPPCDLTYASDQIDALTSEEITPLLPLIGCGEVDSWSVNPAFPDGLILDPETGVITGSVDAPYPATIHQIIAANTTDSTVFELTIVIRVHAPCELDYAVELIDLRPEESLEPITPTSGCGPVDSYSIAPDLPDGIVLHPQSGVISGSTLIEIPQTTYTVTATNATGISVDSFQLIVQQIAPCDLQYSHSEITLHHGEALPSGLLPTTSCGPVEEYTVEPQFPDGITLDPASGLLSGATTEVQALTSHMIRATNTGGFTEFSLMLRVHPESPCDLQYPQSEVVLNHGEALPDGLMPTTACGPVEEYSVDPQLPEGITLDPVSGLISGATNLEHPLTSHLLRASNSGGFTEFTLNLRVHPEPPCDLQYSQSEIVLHHGEALPAGLLPTTSCGPVEEYTVEPQFPDGITLDPASGLLSGATTEVQPLTSHVIRATNTGGFTEFSLMLRVHPESPCDLQYPQSEIVLNHGEALPDGLMPTTSCGPVEEYSVDPQLPEGITLDPVSGLISGATNLEHPLTSHLLRASNSGGFTEFTLNLRVHPEPPCDLQYPQSEIVLHHGEALPAGLLPTASCGPVEEYFVEPQFPEGITLDPATGLLSGATTEVQTVTSHVIRATNTGGSSEYSLMLTVHPELPCDLQYPESEFTLNHGEALPAGLLPTTSCGLVEEYLVDPQLPEGISLDSVSGLLSGTGSQFHPLTSHVIRAANSGGFTEFTLMLEVKPEGPCDLMYIPGTFTLEVDTPMSSVLPQFACGTPTSYQISPQLPGGLTLDPQTGEFSGQPTEVLSLTLFTITAANETASTSTQIAIQVKPQPPCEFSYPETLLEAMVGISIPPLIPEVGCGGADQFSIDTQLPEGLILDLETGVITGIPTSVGGPTDHVILASNESGDVSFQLSIHIGEEPPCNLTYSENSIDVVVGEEIGPFEPLLGCGEASAWSVSPNLPDGLNLDPLTGVISGSVGDPYPDTIHQIVATNSSGSAVFDMSVQIKIQAPCNLDYGIDLTILLPGEVLGPITPSVDCGPVSQYTIEPELPSAFTLDPQSGELTGSSQVDLLVTTYTITATNTTGGAEFTFQLGVAGTAPCDLSYPAEPLAVPSGVFLEPQIPAFSCGFPDLWEIDPALPAGLEFDEVTGAISGTALSEGESTHLITAVNEFGPSEPLELSLVIGTVYFYRGSELVIPYSVADGNGTGLLTLNAEENSLNTTYPTELSGLSMAITYDSGLLEFVSETQGQVIQSLNDGAGPDFWAVNAVENAVLVGLLASFTFVDILTLPTETAIIDIEFATIPEVWAGDTSGLSGHLSWGNPTSIPLDNLVVIDGASSSLPVMVPIPYHIQPQ